MPKIAAIHQPQEIRFAMAMAPSTMTRITATGVSQASMLVCSAVAPVMNGEACPSASSGMRRNTVRRLPPDLVVVCGPRVIAILPFVGAICLGAMPPRGTRTKRGANRGETTPQLQVVEPFLGPNCRETTHELTGVSTPRALRCQRLCTAEVIQLNEILRGQEQRKWISLVAPAHPRGEES